MIMDEDIYCYNNHKIFFNKYRTCDSFAIIFILDKTRDNAYITYAVCKKCLYALPLRDFEQEISKKEYIKYKKAELLL